MKILQFIFLIILFITAVTSIPCRTRAPVVEEVEPQPERHRREASNNDGGPRRGGY
ncbi:CLUMA_CG002408, isoform A [Clunio marinus]|uniref:CLUMA_CG002408, isoform A n=1 Tax=Clunio marinus TaxID=568069 RepID=A0A1J1HKT6_9DIPT|nr:CLUMA_CG002408, isoform A [Clunio marinus]